MLAVTAGLLCVVCFLSQPVGWLAATIGVSALVAKAILSTAVAAGGVLYFGANWQKASFEITSWRRFFYDTNYHQIQLINGEPLKDRKIYLGALPNELNFEEMKRLIASKLLAVLSINEPWERTPHLRSHPVSEKRWKELGVEYKAIDSKDHIPLDIKVMDEAAEWIDEQVKGGRNIYVHCRAGVGRSATAIAAYLIKYTDMSIEDICVSIRGSRNNPPSTIWDKVPALVSYQNFYRPDKKVSEKIQTIAGAFDSSDKDTKIRKIKNKEIKKECKDFIAKQMERFLKPNPEQVSSGA
jgi:hypothetical protein